MLAAGGRRPRRQALGCGPRSGEWSVAGCTGRVLLGFVGLARGGHLGASGWPLATAGPRSRWRLTGACPSAHRCSRGSAPQLAAATTSPRPHAPTCAASRLRRARLGNPRSHTLPGAESPPSEWSASRCVDAAVAHPFLPSRVTARHPWRLRMWQVAAWGRCSAPMRAGSGAGRGAAGISLPGPVAGAGPCGGAVDAPLFCPARGGDGSAGVRGGLGSQVRSGPGCRASRSSGVLFQDLQLGAAA